eukprot:3911679-Amphidinium_carterae.1
MQIHPLGALPLKATVTWTESLDKEMRDIITRITDIPIQPDCAAFSYPPSVGSLGFTSLRREVAAHRISHLLTERLHQRVDSSVWSQDSIATFETYAAEAAQTVEAVLGKYFDSLRTEGFQKTMKRLRVPIYRKGIGLGCSVLAPPSMVTVPHASALMHRAALQWHFFLTPYGQFLPDPAYRTTLRH